MFAVQPHDMLRLAGATVLPTDAPFWAVRALEIAPWVVVRRAAAAEGFIAVGVRGTIRSERYATEVRVADVLEAVAPEALAHLACHGRDLPAMRTLSAVRPILDGTGLAWGPTGSVGFELVTGQSTVTTDSDLDLLVRTYGGAGALPVLTRLHHELGALAARVDCQIDTPAGAMALGELAGGQPDVMLRTAEGPRLVARAAVS